MRCVALWGRTDEVVVLQPEVCRAVLMQGDKPLGKTFWDIAVHEGKVFECNKRVLLIGRTRRATQQRFGHAQVCVAASRCRPAASASNMGKRSARLILMKNMRAPSSSTTLSLMHPPSARVRVTRAKKFARG